MEICKDLSNRLTGLEFGKCEDPRRKSLIQCSCKVVCVDLSAFYILCCFHAVPRETSFSTLLLCPLSLVLAHVQFIMFNSLCPDLSPLGPTSTLAVQWLNEDVDMAVSLPWNKQPAPRRNSVVQTKLSGLWQASASSLGKNELAFGAVSVNLPHLSAEISKSVKSSKSTFVRGFAHGSTHNGIRLESTEKRKATLLGTLEDGVQYAETFKAACRRKYGNMTRAWRILLDPGGNGRVSFVPFCNAARSMGFVNVSTQLGKKRCKRPGWLGLTWVRC